MKSLFKFWLLVCMSFFSVACLCSEKLTGNEFLIEGRIFGVEDGGVIHLLRGKSIATDTLSDGRFTFKEEALSDMEQLVVVSWDEGFIAMPLFVWVAPGAKIKINGKGKLFPTWNVKSSVPNQKEENRYKKKTRNIIAEYSHMEVEINNLRTKASTDSSGDEALKYRTAADSLRVTSDSLRDKEFFINMDIMTKTNTSPVWLDKMLGVVRRLRYANSDNIELRKKAETLYGRISEDDKNTSSGYQITAFLFPPTVAKVGDNMADADLLDIIGNTKRLSDYSGKYLLLNFWSSGCENTIMALPEMKEISDTYSENLTIISISMDTDTTWKKT